MPRCIQSLSRVSWLMAGLTMLFTPGLVMDSRTIDGAPGWLKPAKFAVSLSIYGFTVAWSRLRPSTLRRNQNARMNVWANNRTLFQT